MKNEIVRDKRADGRKSRHPEKKRSFIGTVLTVCQWTTLGLVLESAELLHIVKEQPGWTPVNVRETIYALEWKKKEQKKGPELAICYFVKRRVRSEVRVKIKFAEINLNSQHAAVSAATAIADPDSLPENVWFHGLTQCELYVRSA